jgi:hypothetical protein
MTGKYFEHVQAVELPRSSDEDSAKLLKLCEQRTGVDFAKILQELEMAN